MFARLCTVLCAYKSLLSGKMLTPIEPCFSPTVHPRWWVHSCSKSERRHESAFAGSVLRWQTFLDLEMRTPCFRLEAYEAYRTRTASGFGGRNPMIFGEAWHFDKLNVGRETIDSIVPPGALFSNPKLKCPLRSTQKLHDSGRLAMWLQRSLSQRFGVFNRHWKIHWHCGESKAAVTSVESNLKGSKWRSGAAIAEMGQDSLFVESLVTATQNAFKWLLHMFALPFYFGSWHVLTTISSQVLAARNLRSQSHSPGFWRGLAASIAIFRAFPLLHVYHNNVQVLSFFDFRWFENFEEPRNVSDRGIQELQKKQKEPLWKCTSVWIKHAKTEIASEAKDITEHRPLRSMYHTVVAYLDILTVTCFNLQRIQFSHVLCVCVWLGRIYYYRIYSFGLMESIVSKQSRG